MPPADDRTTPVGRRIAIGGTFARLLVGSLLLGSVIAGQTSSGWYPLSWLLGLLVAPAVLTGCELLAIPNWLLGRDDQVGCLLFAPIDLLEHRNTRDRRPSHSQAR